MVPDFDWPTGDHFLDRLHSFKPAAWIARAYGLSLLGTIARCPRIPPRNCRLSHCLIAYCCFQYFVLPYFFSWQVLPTGFVRSWSHSASAWFWLSSADLVPTALQQRCHLMSRAYKYDSHGRSLQSLLLYPLISEQVFSTEAIGTPMIYPICLLAVYSIRQT